MSVLVKPPHCVALQVDLPASKSISNRAIILNALSQSEWPIEHIATCDDTRVMINAFSSDSNQIDIMAAGTAMRFLTAYLAQSQSLYTITGSERMRQRPIAILVDALRHLGAQIEYVENEGFPPLRITGNRLKGGDLYLKGSVSSQYISALLMIAPYMEQPLHLHLTGEVISRPYIDMTLQLMQQYGITATWQGNSVSIAQGEYTPIPFCVESDWSAASYWYQIAALAPEAEITLLGLNRVSTQGDARVAELFAQLGVETTYTTQGVVLTKSNDRTERFDCDLTNQPDLAQTFVVTAALLEIPFTITGLQSLKIKETDRIVALKNELKKLGYTITDSNNSILSWSGERCNPDYTMGIDTYDDHRMAMAFAPAALRHSSLVVNHPEVVTKSYPQYWEHLSAAGFQIVNLDTETK